MDKQIFIKKQRKVPVQRVQIDLYKQQSPGRIRKKSQAVSNAAFSVRSVNPSPIVSPGAQSPIRLTSNRNIQKLLIQKDPQFLVSQQQLQDSLSKQLQEVRQSTKSVAKFHSRQNSTAKIPITERNRSNSPGHQIYGTLSFNPQKILKNQKENNIKRPSPNLRMKTNRELNKIQSVQQMQELSKQKSLHRITSAQTSLASSRAASPRFAIVPTQEDSTDNYTKSHDEEKKQIIKYLKQYYDKNKTIPLSTPQFYHFIKLIGKGGFAKVALAIHKLTNMEVAIKTINKKKIRDENHKHRIMQEAFMLRRMNHQNIVKCFEIFETQKYIMIIMENCKGGSLNKLLKQVNQLSENQCKHIFKQLIKAVHCVHFNRILHRDIKPGNILLVQQLNQDYKNYYPDIKLCDFGTSTYVNYGETIHRQCGTPSYIAPEIAADNGYDGFNSDIWGLGVVLFELITGMVPFRAPSLRDLKYVILNAQYQFPPRQKIDPQIVELIQQMLLVEPNERIPIRQMLKNS